MCNDFCCDNVTLKCPWREIKTNADTNQGLYKRTEHPKKVETCFYGSFNYCIFQHSDGDVAIRHVFHHPFVIYNFLAWK